MISGLTEKLGRFLSVDGISVVAVVSRDGFIIDSVGANNLDLDSLGLMVATADEAVFQATGLVELDRQSSKLVKGHNKVLMGQVSEEILALIVEEDKESDWVFDRTKNYINILTDALSLSVKDEVTKKKIYRYASGAKADGLQEFKSSAERIVPGSKLESLDLKALNELVELSEALFIDGSHQQPILASTPMYKRFLSLLYALHDDINDTNKNYLHSSDFLTHVAKLQSVLLTTKNAYYRVLALPAQADDAAIKKHFGIFKDIYSCDESIDPDYSSVLTISKAFLVLRSPQRRWIYDSAQYIEVKGRMLAKQVLDYDWVENSKKIIVRPNFDRVTQALNSKRMREIANKSGQTIAGLSDGMKKLYSDIKGNNK